MGTGVLGLGTGGAGALNQEVLDKLKKADEDAIIKPLEKKT